MKNWTVRQRITWSFGSVILLMIAMGVFAFTQLDLLRRETTDISQDSVPGLYHGAKLVTSLFNVHINTERYIGSANDDMRAEMASHLQSIQSDLDNALEQYEAGITTEAGQKLLQQLKSELTVYQSVRGKVMKFSLAHDNVTASRLLASELEPEFERMKLIAVALLRTNKAEVDESTALILRTVKAAEIGLVVVMVMVIVFVLALISAITLVRAIDQPLRVLIGLTEAMRQADFTKRANLDRRDEFRTLGDGFDRMAEELTSLVGQVKKSVTQVNTSVTEISATAREQQATASEIAATTSEIGATSKEITATSKELARTMGEVSEVAEGSATLADSGREGLAHMEETMQQVMAAAGGVKAKLAILSEKAGNINQVVTTITKVADQTNLLSLNAAIEAEKAGEYGRGFAVVATEIRRLADQTAVATFDIEQMVKEMVSAVAAGVMGMDKFSEEVRRGMGDVQQVGGQLAQIIQGVQALAPRMEAVTEGVLAQSTGAEQISQALSQLSEAAQQTVESLQQSNVAMEGLNEVSRDLRDGVSRFKLAAPRGGADVDKTKLL